MKKFTLRVANIFIIVGFLWTLISFLYITVLPSEIKASIPQFTWVTALLSGGTTGLFASGAVYVKAFIQKRDIEVDDKLKGFADYMLQIISHYEEMIKNYEKIAKDLEDLVVENNKRNINNKELNKDLNRLRALLEVELQTKLTNPLIDKEADKIIRGILNEKENNL